MPWNAVPGFNLRDIAMILEQTICLIANRDLGNRTQTWGPNFSEFEYVFRPLRTEPNYVHLNYSR